MTGRPTWKGLLKISLVTIPIKVYPATETGEALSFHQLHAGPGTDSGSCLTRMQQRRWCPQCVREVASVEIVKGFEFESGKYVTLSDAELAGVKPASTRIIDLVQFGEAAALDLTHIQRSYYVAPESPRAAEAFAVIRAAMLNQVGIGKVALYGREYLVAVRPQAAIASAMLLHTLHHAAEIRTVDHEAAPRVLRDQVVLARKVIAAITRPRLDLADFTDTYRDGVRRLIDAKIAGKEIVVPTVIEDPPVVTLREALTQSLLAVSAKKKTAKALTKALSGRRRVV